jgi:hypothetical protein
MHIIKKILNEIDDVLLSDYDINLQGSEFDSLILPITDDCGKLDPDIYARSLDQSKAIITRILEVHGKAEIVKFLRELALIEPDIQELQPRVRDHVVHAIYTFLVGAYIIKKVNMPQNVEMQYCYPFIWKLCGPVHDIGYTIEISRYIENPFLNDLNAILMEMDSTSPKVLPPAFPKQLAMLCNGRDANQLIQNRLNEWALGIDIEDYYHWLTRENLTDHGVIGALAELKFIDALYQSHNPTRAEVDIVEADLNYNEKTFMEDIVSAASAIFIHNINPDYDGFSRKIDFQIAPMAFMLFMCDTFQEWDRYTKKEDEVYSGDLFDIVCSRDRVSLSVPDEVEDKIITALKRRLSGLSIKVNGRKAVS